MKRELLVNPFHVAHIKQLCEVGADAFLIGTGGIGMRLPASFSLEEIAEACKIKEQYGKKLYIAMNGLYHNEQIDALEGYMCTLQDMPIDGIVFGDPAILMLHRKIGCTIDLHWNTETTGTNWFTCNYWGERGAKRAVLAPELSLDTILEIQAYAKVEIQVQIHGMMNMFHSKRTLLDHYYQHVGKEDSNKNRYQDQMALLDRERGANYPIYQDSLGTHMMSPKDVCMIDDLDELIDGEISSFFLNFMFKSEQYACEITALYREAIDLCIHHREEYDQERQKFLERVRILQPKDRDLDQGFFYKETVY